MSGARVETRNPGAALSSYGSSECNLYGSTMGVISVGKPRVDDEGE
jgi:hypothetical protein